MPDRQNVMVQTSVLSSTTRARSTRTRRCRRSSTTASTPSVDAFRPTSRPSGFYDRVNREFLGFGHITITRIGDGLQIQRFYDNKNYAGRHQLLREEIRDAALAGGPKLFRRTENTYDQRRRLPSGIDQ